MGSGTHCSKINGFPGTHGTHANEATDIYEKSPKSTPRVWLLEPILTHRKKITYVVELFVARHGDLSAVSFDFSP